MGPRTQASPTRLARPKVESGVGLLCQDRAKGVRAGERVRVLAKYIGYLDDKKETLLIEGLLLDRGR